MSLATRSVGRSRRHRHRNPWRSSQRIHIITLAFLGHSWPTRERFLVTLPPLSGSGAVPDEDHVHGGTLRPVRGREVNDLACTHIEVELDGPGALDPPRNRFP